jgi:hypothetical protein
MIQTSFCASAPKFYEPVHLSNTCHPRLNGGRVLLRNRDRAKTVNIAVSTLFWPLSHVESDKVIVSGTLKA